MKRLVSPSALCVCVLGSIVAAQNAEAEVVSLDSSASATALSGTVTFSARIAPDIKVVSVDFKVGDVTIHTATSAPYSCQLNTRILWGPYKIQATAHDQTGNAWTSSESVRVSQSIDGPKYKSSTAKLVAENMLLFQRDNGGWPKNVDMAAPLGPIEKKLVLADKNRSDTTTIDNSATWGQIEFLARANAEQPNPVYQGAIEKGVNYLLDAQYPNGGWPQFYPKKYYLDYTGYSTGITFNDDAMIGTIRLLRDVAQRTGGFSFIDPAFAQRARQAVDRGIQNILDTQLPAQSGSRRAAWAQQYDPSTLEPISARPFEPTAACAYESTDILKFLMSIPHPSPQVISAVEGGVAWLDTVTIKGKQWDQKSGKLSDHAQAPSLWSRFYEIGTDRPIFGANRTKGGVVYDIGDVDPQLRTTYTWFHRHPAELLETDYPAWKARMASQKLNDVSVPPN